ncbi:hypothetical protein [Algoriphagus sp. AK58]|uniref:hypothetical protein n=1 Tax=Algoriphagus sp. AK58 TaxID=1406877 RepID=UPI00164F8308|nr:hypothetical protein [Algoriphagus sp. AK58]MBC6368690.1 hypothetical protein [Algoriphagus sp. AK58]
MNVKYFSLFICLTAFACSTPNISDLGNSGFEIELETVFINHYKSDSLNKSRPLVLPRVYFTFRADNSSSDSVLVILNKYFRESEESFPHLYVLFKYGNSKDTLILSDYESVNPIIISPYSKKLFVVGAPVFKYVEMDKYKSETASTLMKHIADNCEVIYRSPKPEDARVLKSQTIKKSKDFRVLFRDPADTTVE